MTVEASAINKSGKGISLLHRFDGDILARYASPSWEMWRQGIQRASRVRPCLGVPARLRRLHICLDETRTEISHTGEPLPRAKLSLLRLFEAVARRRCSHEGLDESCRSGHHLFDGSAERHFIRT
jgi:hypothetical protein